MPPKTQPEKLTGNAEFSYSEAMEIADAIYQRERQDSLIKTKISTEIQGGDPNQAALNYEWSSTKTLAFMRLQNPDAIITNKDEWSIVGAESTHLISGLFDQIAAGLKIPAGSLSATPEEIKIQLLKIVEKSQSDPQEKRDRFNKDVAAAAEVAREHDASIASVYLDDSLNSEALKKAYTPSEYAEKFKQEVQVTDLGLEALTELLTNKLSGPGSEKLVKSWLPILSNGEIDAENIQETEAEMGSEFFTNLLQAMMKTVTDKLKPELAKVTEKTTESLRQYYTWKIVKLWGKGGLDKLTAKQRQALEPREPYTAVVAEVLGSGKKQEEKKGKVSPNDIRFRGLKSLVMDLSVADVSIEQDEEGYEAKLSFTGKKGTFEHTFEDGELRVTEKQKSGVYISGDSVSGQSVVIVNGRVISGNVTRVSKSNELPSVHLQLPKGTTFDKQAIETASGDISLEQIKTKILKIASKSGDLALRQCSITDLYAKTMKGNIDIDKTVISSEATVDSMSGDVEVTSSKAPRWDIKTMSGDISGSGNKGQFNTRTMTGDVDID